MCGWGMVWGSDKSKSMQLLDLALVGISWGNSTFLAESYGMDSVHSALPRFYPVWQRRRATLTPVLEYLVS
jgi:hypothetical protein